jgi:vitamin B12 transporter
MTYAEPQPDMLPNAYRNFTADADLGYQALDNLGLRLAGRWAKGRVQLDKGYGDSWDAENYWTDFARFQSRLEANLDLWKKLWRQQFSLALSQNERVSTNDSKMPGYPLPSRYLGRHLAVEWKHQFRDLVAGAVYSQEQGTYHDENYFPFMNPDLPEHSSHQVGLYLENRFHWEALVMDAGIRWDIHDQYGSQTTYRLTPVYLLAATNTRFKGSYGIGFKAPSLDQLYADYGNTSLKPETSTGWEAGLEQGFWLKQMTMGLTYFQTDFENQISYDFASAKDRNLGRVQTKGWEAFAAWQMVSPLNLKLSYTKLTANDLTHADIVGPQTLPNGSDYKMILSADYHWEALHGSIQIARVGPHYDMTEGFQPRPLLAPYTEVDLTAAWAFTPELQVYAKINNLLDADYIEVVGYNTPRFAAYGGIEVKLP